MTKPEHNSQNQPKPPGKRRRRVTYTIAFRLEGYHVSLLERGAGVYGISVHEYARQRLVELLERHEEARLLDEAAATRQSVDGLREDLARALEVLLLNLTQTDAATIRSWIDRSLRGG